MKQYRTYYEGPGRYGRYSLLSQGLCASEAKKLATEYRRRGIRARIQKAPDGTRAVYLRQQ